MTGECWRWVWHKGFGDFYEVIVCKSIKSLKRDRKLETVAANDALL